MNDTELAWLKARQAVAWERRDLTTVDLVTGLMYKLNHLQAVADAAAALNTDASSDRAWENLMDALALVDTGEAA